MVVHWACDISDEIVFPNLQSWLWYLDSALLVQGMSICLPSHLSKAYLINIEACFPYCAFYDSQMNSVLKSGLVWSLDPFWVQLQLDWSLKTPEFTQPQPNHWGLVVYGCIRKKTLDNVVLCSLCNSHTSIDKSPIYRQYSHRHKIYSTP